mmetsp:Transcript_44542/g.104072  ORF Transcript_44542/g.104072 Transcript_44542/m.104072 type:complete len:212 (+) Transcript_44542:148-783(+)
MEGRWPMSASDGAFDPCCDASCVSRLNSFIKSFCFFRRACWSFTSFATWRRCCSVLRVAACSSSACAASAMRSPMRHASPEASPPCSAILEMRSRSAWIRPASSSLSFSRFAASSSCALRSASNRCSSVCSASPSCATSSSKLGCNFSPARSISADSKSEGSVRPRPVCLEGNLVESCVDGRRGVDVHGLEESVAVPARSRLDRFRIVASR